MRAVGVDWRSAAAMTSRSSTRADPLPARPVLWPVSGLVSSVRSGGVFVGGRLLSARFSCGRQIATGAVACGLLLVMSISVGLGLATPVRLDGRAAAPARAELRGVSGLAAVKKLEGLPAVAQAVISRSLGADQAAFRAARTGSGWRVAAGGVTAVFRRGDVRFGAVGGTLSFALAGVGHGGVLRVVRAARPVGVANRVSYRRGGIEEWYAAGPLGLEQGFTLERRSAVGGRAGLLTLALRIAGTLSPRIVRGGPGVVFAAAGGRVVLRYGGLAVSDARGRHLRSWLGLVGGRVLIRVADAGARYPLRVDPIIEAKLSAFDGAASDELGASVAVSGGTVVAGADLAKVGLNASQGAVYVFSEPAAGWGSSPPQVTKLTAFDGAAGDDLGLSVAVSGGTVVAGAPFARVGSNGGQGAAYVFSEPAAGWGSSPPQVTKLTASDGAANDELGFSVAVSGGTVVAGAWSAMVGSNASQGAAYVFSEPAAGWGSSPPQVTKLTAFDGAASDLFGVSVAVSGGTVVAGAYLATVGSISRQGAAYVLPSPRPDGAAARRR
jgi:hypothetical protein